MNILLLRLDMKERTPKTAYTMFLYERAPMLLRGSSSAEEYSSFFRDCSKAWKIMSSEQRSRYDYLVNRATTAEELVYHMERSNIHNIAATNN